MNTSEILVRAANLIERQGLAQITVFDAITVAAGAQPGQPLSYEAYTAARDFSRWLGFDANGELAVEGALGRDWADRPENTENNIISALRRAAVDLARLQIARRAARGVAL